jgi:hypothetical protein
MADGLLSSALGAIDRTKQALGARFGLLASNPEEFARQLAAEARQRAGVGLLGEPKTAEEMASGAWINTPYGMQAMQAGSGFAGSIAPKTTRNLHDFGWYHGTTGDIRQFRPDLLGEATGAASAKEGFFFARDPKNPPKEMTMKSSDPDVINMLKNLGKSDAEIAAMNKVSMEGHGAHTASGYAQLGGDREYREAMRLASIAEQKRNWPEYEKQMQIAENVALSKNNQLQLLTAKHGEARDTMLSKIQDSWYNKPMSQKEAEASDAEFKKLMGYGWYNNPTQVDTVKKELINRLGKDKAASAIKAIDNYKSVVAERLAAESNSGANVMPVALRYKNPMYYDFKGSAYRDQTYSDLVKEAKAKGHDALILQNTYDPGAGTAKLVDVGVVFDPSQIRSKFAKFDPKDINSPDILAAGVPLGLIAGTNVEMPKKKQNK